MMLNRHSNQQQQRFQDIGHQNQDESRIGTARSKQSSATLLICDYSEQELHQLLMNSSEALGAGGQGEGMNQSAALDFSDGNPNDFGALSSGGAAGQLPNQVQDSQIGNHQTQYNMLTRLNDEEENVDFMQMFNQYHHHKQQEQQSSAIQFHNQQQQQQPSQLNQVSEEDSQAVVVGGMGGSTGVNVKASTQSGITPGGGLNSGSGSQHQVQYYNQDRLANEQVNRAQNPQQMPESYTATTSNIQSHQTLLGQQQLGGQRFNASTRVSAAGQQKISATSYASGVLADRQQQQLARPGKYGGNLRPGSATVAGQAGRFLANQQSKKRYDQLNHLDNFSYSYQQPQPMHNNLMTKSSQAALTYGQVVGTQRNSSNAYGGMVQQTSLMKPPAPFGQRRRTRPQSAARNQLQPSKNLQSVTNFTYQKAKQNQNQRAYVPESMKHTDKERLYEEKIELQKQINQMQIANQQLKTQVQTQHAHIRQKNNMIQQVMQQVFVPQNKQVHQTDDQFLQQFQEREINHSTGHKAALLLAKQAAGIKFKGVSSTKLSKQSAISIKDGQISSLKLKIKEINEQLLLKEKELSDLKQTLKFTKIKEYETELALNVQEAQRLRVLLEREIQKPKVDPALVQGIRQQNLQQQQIIQNMQRNSQIQQENYEKLNRKMTVQAKKFTKMKEARKKLVEKASRSDKKVLILTRKVHQLEEDLHLQQKTQARNQRQRYTSITSQDQQQQQQHFNDAIQKYNQRFEEQNKIIERLLIIMHDNGIEINEEDLMDDKEQQDPGEDLGVSPPVNAGDVTGLNQGDQMRQSLLDLIVTFGGGPSELLGDASANSLLGITKEIKDTDYRSFIDLKDSLRKVFEIEEGTDFALKHLSDDGIALQLSEDTWQDVRTQQLDQNNNRLQLLLELIENEVILDDDNIGGLQQHPAESAPAEPDASNYEEDEFEEEVVKEKVYVAPIQFEEVEQHFEELRIILQIKKIQKKHVLKYLLTGMRDEATQKKVKRVTIKNLSDGIDKKIGFADPEIATKLAKFLIEKSNEEGKVELMDDAEFKGQTHSEAVWILRKDLHAKVNQYIKDYPIYNGIAITTLLSQIQNMFEDIKDDVKQDLEDQDYEDDGTAKIDDVWKSIQIFGIYPKSLDTDVKDFILFMAMRHSSSLMEVNFKKFMKCFEEGYSILEDGPCRWETTGEQYVPSEDEDELDSDKPPEPEVQEVIEEMEEDAYEEDGQGEGDDEMSKTQLERSNGQILDLEQNELLEKVDEVLMQIVQRLPPTQKIRTLTHLMLPYLTPIYDQEKQWQSLIISQEAFIQFLLGQNKGQLGLQLEESHFICLLHLLVQEDDDEQNEEGEQEPMDSKFILFDEFIELVKTYMKKELIMQQSKSLGIHYDVLGKESVQFLFQLRSRLMYDQLNEGQNNLNENSADDEEVDNDDENRKQKSVPRQIRDIFNQIIQRKSIQLKRDGKATQVEVMDFEQMIDVLGGRLGISSPSPKSSEELKFLMCLDFKYLEMVMLTKLDKIMQDLDYISIDLLRHTQDKDMEHSRQMAISELRRIRDDQLNKMKKKKTTKQNSGSGGYIDEKIDNDGASQLQRTQPSQVEIQGVSHSTQQEKKRKRPDDKRQNVSKKIGGGRGAGTTNFQQQQWAGTEQDQIGNSSGSVPVENQLAGRGIQGSQIDQDHHSAALKSTTSQQTSGVKERYALPQGLTSSDNEPVQFQMNSQDLYAQPVKRNSQRHTQAQKSSNSNMQQDQAIDEDIKDMASGSNIPDDEFDNIDVNLDVEIQRAEQKQAQNKQLAIAAEIEAAANNGSEFDEDNLQDDIPIDDDYDDEDGVISDNYENLADQKKAASQVESSPQKSSQPNQQKPISSVLDENAFSMDHSDDLEDSPMVRSSLKKAQEEKQLLLARDHQENLTSSQKKLKQPPAVGIRPPGTQGAPQDGKSSKNASEDNYNEDEYIDDIEDGIDDDDDGMDIDGYGEEDDDIVDEQIMEKLQRTKDEHVKSRERPASSKGRGFLGPTDVQSQQKKAAEVNIVDDIIDQYSDVDNQASGIKESNDDDDIQAQVAQGRLNFNRFGKDSSIQQENAHGRFGEEDFDDNVQSSSRIDDESPQKSIPNDTNKSVSQSQKGKLRNQDNFNDDRSSAVQEVDDISEVVDGDLKGVKNEDDIDDDIEDNYENDFNTDTNQNIKSDTQKSSRSKIQQQFSDQVTSLNSKTMAANQANQVKKDDAVSSDKYSMEDEVIEDDNIDDDVVEDEVLSNNQNQDKISSQSPQQIAQDTMKPEGRKGSSGKKYSERDFGQDAAIKQQIDDPDLSGSIGHSQKQQLQSFSQDQYYGQKSAVGTNSSRSKAVPVLSSQELGMKSLKSSKDQLQKKPQAAAPKQKQGATAAANKPEKDSDNYSGAFDDDYEF